MSETEELASKSRREQAKSAVGLNQQWWEKKAAATPEQLSNFIASSRQFHSSLASDFDFADNTFRSSKFQILFTFGIFLHDRKIVVFSPLHVTSFMFTKQLRNRFGDYPKVATSSMEIFLIVLLNQKWLDVVYDTFSARVPEHWNAALREAPFRSAAPRGRSAVGAQLRKWTRSASRSATPKICSAPKKFEK